MMERPFIVTTIREAQQVINILHRRSVADKKHLNVLEARIAYLETPWWRFVERRIKKKQIAYAEAAR